VDPRATITGSLECGPYAASSDSERQLLSPLQARFAPQQRWRLSLPRLRLISRPESPTRDQ